MSSNSPNYMDGVPFKISEKHKPPPEVTIPQAVVNRFSTLEEGHYDSPQYTYDFQLEKQVIRKLAEWQKVRETERENRRERIRQNDLQKRRELEERQKQLLTAVSYPSAEDLSSDDEEEAPNIAKEEVVPPQPVIDHHPRQSFDTILQPIVANSYSTHSPSTVFSPSKINYSDFENDTSSPFDNIELKTINDLDILAQVLTDTQRHSVKNGSVVEEEEKKEDEEKEQKVEVVQDSDSKLSPEQPQPIVNSPAASCDPATSDVNVTTTTSNSSSNQNQTANFYYTTNVIPNNYQMMVQQTQTLQLQQQHQHHQHQQYMLNYANMNHHNAMEPSMADVYFNYNSLPAASNHNYLYRDYAQQPKEAAPTAVGHNTNYVYSNGAFGNNYCDSQYGVHSVDALGAGTGLQAEIIPKSKSKSVPDILKELKDEIRDSEIRRTRNHSQTIDDQAKRNSADSAQSLSSPAPTSRSSSSSSTSFMKLSPSSQNLAKNISSMGFPLERVAKIAELYGNDDKKIVEHLIPLSELLDLGFDESKISEALVKFDNNKDKALDFLIS